MARQAALVRAELIGGERAAGHFRLVQASFAAAITEFVLARQAYVSGDGVLAAELAGGALAAVLVVAVENWGARVVPMISGRRLQPA